MVISVLFITNKYIYLVGNKALMHAKKGTPIKKVNYIYNTSGLFILTVYIPSGSIYESVGKNKNKSIAGISHFLEHLLFKHTENYSGKELLEAFTKMGGYYNASTDKDETLFYVKTLAENYQLATDIMYDIVRKPVFKVEDIDAERKVVLEELAQSKDSLDDIVYDSSTATLLRHDNIYLPPVIGKKQDLSVISICDIMKYFKERFQHYMVVVNVDVSYKDVVKKYINSTLGEGAAKAAKDMKSSVNFNEPHMLKLSQYIQSKETIKVVSNATYQYNTVLLFPSYKFSDMKNNNILNFIKFCLTDAGLFSILYYEVREKRGLVYNIKLANERNRYLGIARITFGTSNRDIVGILRVVFDCIQSLKRDGLDKKTLNYFKVSCLNHYKYKFTNEEYRASWYGDNLFYGCQFSEKDLLSCIEGITKEDIMRVATEVFDFKSIGIFTMGNYVESQHMVRKNIDELVTQYQKPVKTSLCPA